MGRQKPSSYNAPKKPTYPAPKKPTYNPPPPKHHQKQVYSQPKRPAYKPQPPPQQKPKQTYQGSYNAPKKQAPVYVPAPKAYHKPPIIIYQGVAPPVHVYEKSAASLPSYNAQAKSSNVVNSNEYKKVPVPAKAQSKSDTQDLDVSSSNTVSVKVSPNVGGSKKINTPKASLQIDPRTPTVAKVSPAQSRSDDVRLLTAPADFESAVVSASVSVSSTDKQPKLQVEYE